MNNSENIEYFISAIAGECMVVITLLLTGEINEFLVLSFKTIWVGLLGGLAGMAGKWIWHKLFPKKK